MSQDQLKGLESCVHCGFCLENCATYRETGIEASSPRGRIVLMRHLAEGRLSVSDPNLASHLDCCLGCGACEPVCPSGVEYRAALERTRHILSSSHSAPFIVRLLNAVMAEPMLHRTLFGVARQIRPLAPMLAGKTQLGFLFGMLAATRPWSHEDQTKDSFALKGRTATPDLSKQPASTVALFEGCVMSGLFSHVHTATERTLGVNRLSMTRVPGQVCCGALHIHAGQHDEALRLARQNVEAFAAVPDSLIAVNSAGCGAMLKDYGTLLAGDPLEEKAAALAERVRDASELLAERGPRRGGNVRLTVAYDPPCHLLHAQGISEAPHAMLDAVPGIEILPHAEPELCCGSAGSYSFTQSRMSRAVLARKTKALLDAAPDIVATGNPGCIMQIGAGLLAAGSKLTVVHPIEILDRSYARAGFYD